MTFTVALVGRPNVGKSTLFNRLIGRRLALVDNTPGVTRDWREADGGIGDLLFKVVDTAGLEEAFDDSLEARMRRQTEQALDRADVVVFMIDARAGITPLDRHFAAWLRKGTVPVLLIANKAEGRTGEAGLYEAYELGLGEPIPLSAEHGEGLTDLFDALLPFERPDIADEVLEQESMIDASVDDEGDEIIVEREPGPIKLAIVGRPNVGKSTLVNAILGEDRVLTGPEPGMTRDAISVDFEWQGQAYALVDTAGMRRRSKVVDKLEKLAVSDSLNAIRMAQIVALVIEPDGVLDRQDLAIARLVEQEGRALILVVNKWDLADDKQALQQAVRDKLEITLAQMRGLPVVTLSALKRQGLDRLFKAATGIYATWNTRVPTGKLNRWLDGMLAAHSPPLVKGRPNKVRYITQIKTRPPTFTVWVSRPADTPDAYVRYLVNGLRDSFGLDGVPIRVHLRTSKNPYAN